MSQIKISVPHYDHVALRAMAKALEEIAAARAEEEGVEERMNHYNINIDTTQPGLSAARLRECANYLEPVAEVDTAGQQYESLNLDGRDVEKTAEMVRKVAPIVTTTDSTGTPWDERIHSASKALNSDGTWRVRRKPKDMDEVEWSDFVEMVKADLQYPVECGGQEPESDENVKVVEEETLAQIQELINKPAAPTDALKQLLSRVEPPVTPQGDDFHMDAGVVTEQEVASIPAPPPPPVVTVSESTAPFGHDYAHYTFPQVMQFLTQNHRAVMTNGEEFSSAVVDQIIADMGLNSIMDIRDNTEHAGPFIARVKALLGE